MAELLEFALEILFDRKCVGREQPILLGKEPLFGKRVTNCRSSVFDCINHFDLTSNLQRPMQPLSSTLDVGRSALGVCFYLPAAICFSASLTNSSEDFSPSFCCSS